MGRCAEILLDPVSGLTPKEQAFASEVIATGSATAAMQKVYNPDTKLYMRQMAHAVMERPDVKAEIARQYRRDGINEDYVLSSAMVYTELGKKDHRWAGAGVSALTKLGQFTGTFKGDSPSGDVNIGTINVLQLNAGEIEKRANLLADRLAALEANVKK